MDNLAQRCGQQLLSLGVELDPEGSNYNLADVCVQICSFMRDEGFGPLEGVHHPPVFLHVVEMRALLLHSGGSAPTCGSIPAPIPLEHQTKHPDGFSIRLRLYL